MRSYGPQFDPDGIVQHAPVSQANAYDIATILWRYKVANGTIRCELLRAITGTGKRIVQLIAEYTDGDSLCSTVRMCESPADEIAAKVYLERMIIEASRRGPGATVAPAPAAPPASSP